MTTKCRLMTVLGAWWMLSCAGCTYYLQGVVVEGSRPGVMIVDAADPRLFDAEAPRVSAMLDVTLDPAGMSQKELGEFQTDYNGAFQIPIRSFGAGVLEYEVELVARHRGYGPVVEIFPLPRSNQRLLVVMSAGRDTLSGKRDWFKETIEAGRRFGAGGE